MREQWSGKMAEYNCCCSNQSFSGLTTSPFQDYQIFQKQLISCACSKYHNIIHPLNKQTKPMPNIIHPLNKQRNPMPDRSHTTKKQTKPMPNIIHPPNKQTNPLVNIILKKTHKSKHNFLNGINIAYIMKTTS